MGSRKVLVCICLVAVYAGGLLAVRQLRRTGRTDSPGVPRTTSLWTLSQI